jgi:hypothetical protein
MGAMSEIDLINAVNSYINLAYTTSQWWITVTFALIVSTHFAAKHIATPLFAAIIVLYLLSATSVIYELTVYTSEANYLAVRLAEYRASHQVPDIHVGAPNMLGILNGFTTYGIFIVGTISAMAYSFVSWRAASTTKA